MRLISEWEFLVISGELILSMALVHWSRVWGLCFLVMSMMSLYSRSGVVGKIYLKEERMRSILKVGCLLIRDYLRYFLWAYSTM